MIQDWTIEVYVICLFEKNEAKSTENKTKQTEDRMPFIIVDP